MFGLSGLSVETRNFVSRSMRVSRVTSTRPLSLLSKLGRFCDWSSAVGRIGAAQISGKFVPRPVRLELQFRHDHRIPRRRRIIRAGWIVVVSAGEFDRGLEVEGADLNAERIERRFFRHHTAALQRRIRQRIGGDIIGRGAPAGDTDLWGRRRKPGGCERVGDRRSVTRWATTEMAAPWRSPRPCPSPLLVASGLVVAGLVLSGLVLASRLWAFARGDETGGAGAGLEGEGRRESAPASFLAPGRWKRALRGSPSSCGRSSVALLSAWAPVIAPATNAAGNATTNTAGAPARSARAEPRSAN